MKNKKGIYEYILGGCTDTRLLEVRCFDEPTKKTVYARQTEEAKAHGVSNCPLCAQSQNAAQRVRMWKLTEMDADHVTAWSCGGATDIANCSAKPTTAPKATAKPGKAYRYPANCVGFVCGAYAIERRLARSSS